MTFGGAGAQLAGTTTVPRGRAEPLPGGVDRWTGPAGRHNDDPSGQLRDHLVDGGVAVLTYDKRGAGHPDGVWHSATVDDLAGDASAALAAPSAGSAVAADRVGVLGTQRRRVGRAALDLPGHFE